MKESDKIWFMMAVVFGSVSVLFLVVTMPEAEVCHKKIDPKIEKPGLEWCSTKTLFGLMNMGKGLKHGPFDDDFVNRNRSPQDTQDLMFISRSFFLAALLLGVIAVTLLAFPTCTGMPILMLNFFSEQVYDCC